MERESGIYYESLHTPELSETTPCCSLLFANLPTLKRKGKERGESSSSDGGSGSVGESGRFLGDHSVPLLSQVENIQGEEMEGEERKYDGPVPQVPLSSPHLAHFLHPHQTT